MAGASRFMTMEEVMETLQIDKQELDQFISEGKLSPIRDAGKLKFRRQEVEEIKTATETEATVVFDNANAPSTDESSHEFDDGLFIVGDKKGESSDDEATIISIPGAQPEQDSDTGSVLVSAGADEDSDQTSIIPPSSDDVEGAVKEEEESIFDFGAEDITLEETDHVESDSDVIGTEESDSALLASSADESDSSVLVAAADDSSSDILAESDSSSDVIAADSDSSSDIIAAAEDSSSDILSVSVADDGTETVSDILELSEESDDALASVQVDAGAADDDSSGSEEVVGNLLETIEDAAEESSSQLLAVGEEGLETADTIDLTVADDDATATVAEVLEEPDATEPGVLTGGEETLEGVEFGEETGAGVAAAAGLTEMALPEGFVFGPAPKSPVCSTVLLLSAVILLLGATYVACAILGAPVPLPEQITQTCTDLVQKVFASLFHIQFG